MTQHYGLFGGTLRSEVQIDDLPVADAHEPDWTLRVVDGIAPPPTGESLGSDVVHGETRVHGYREAGGYALVFDDTGRFDVSADGTDITWHRPPDVELQAVQADITSRVLALALHAGGVFTLHASAVSLHGSGLAFLAPKYHGKSTICSALVVEGARALSDDTVPVRVGPVPTLSPGVPRLRLWTDAAARLFGTEAEPTLRKRIMDQLDDHQVETGSVAFSAAYILNPVSDLPGGAAAERQRLDSVGATMSLVMHSKIGAVLAGSESAAVLSQAAEIASAVPVYALYVVRDLDRIGEVAKQLVGWHQDPPA